MTLIDTGHTTDFRGAQWRLYALPPSTGELIRTAQDALAEMRRIHGDSQSFIRVENALAIVAARYGDATPGRDRAIPPDA